MGSFSTTTAAIQLNNLSKTYGKKRGVNKLNLRVDKGEIFGFIGPNGAGKSTTIRMLLQLIAPTSGELSVLGQKVERDNPDLRSRIGYLPSEINLYPNMTGQEILEITARVREIDLGKSLVPEYITRLQLNTKSTFKSYSLGNKKKLGILLTLLHDPELLILDEPTSGLDPLAQLQFFEIVKELNERRGTTVFFSTHVLTEVEKLCDRVAIIRDGELIRVSPVSDLTTNGDHFFKFTCKSPGDLRQEYGLFGIDPNTEYMDGVYRLRASEDKFRVLLKILGNKPIKDLNVRRLTLEERFMDEYRLKMPRKSEGVGG